MEEDTDHQDIYNLLLIVLIKIERFQWAGLEEKPYK